VSDRRSIGARNALLAVESTFGDEVSRQIRRHHRRRLEKLGWERALDPGTGPWASGDPPPRDGNAVEVLVDGAAALPSMADAIRSATSHVHIAGWYFTPGFALEREGIAVVLRNLLAEVAERADVRVLAWAGAPLPLFRPSRDDVRAMQHELTAGTRIRCALDAQERPLHCHHEKTIVVDDRVAFVGGIDLTAEAGDRFDTSGHPSRAAVGWHDAAVRLEGPAVTDVAEHFRMRWSEVTGETLPEAAEAPIAERGIQVQVVKTVPEGIYRAVPRGDFRILESYVRAFRNAERFIYVENQFLWSPEITTVLVDKIADPPREDFRVLLVLPVRPNSGDDDTRGALSELIEADTGAGRVLACTIYAHTALLSDPVYVHAKIGIVDDEWLTVGSANLNEHSLFNDTEMNVVMRDPELATTTRRRLWAEHLELPLDLLPDDPIDAIETLWKPISAEQLERRHDGKPLTHRLVRLPHVSKRSRRVLGPIDGLFVDG
jgi:phosphatidylserine/phosphatidylglycerophosphate/cardiolipin synthase-like enzyme